MELYREQELQHPTYCSNKAFYNDVNYSKLNTYSFCLTLANFLNGFELQFNACFLIILMSLEFLFLEL